MFTILNEAKLSTEDRKDLDSKMFGLPEQRKYPLNDEEHVRKAVQFFKFCPNDKKNELAKNINKRIKELNMNIDVDKKNPFYKYVDRRTVSVTESAATLSFHDINYLYRINDVIEHTQNDNIRNFFDKYMNKSSCDSFETIKQAEIDANQLLGLLESEYKALSDKNDDFKYINPLSAMNVVIDDLYSEYFNFLEYYCGKKDAKLYYMILRDIFNSATKKIRDNKAIDKELDLINMILNKVPGNTHYIYRKLRELDCEIYVVYNYRFDDPNRDRLLSDVNNVRNAIKIYDLRYPAARKNNGYDDFAYVISLLPNEVASSVKFDELKQYLMYIKKEVETELFNECDIKVDNAFIRTSLDGMPEHIKNILDYLNYYIHPKCTSHCKYNQLSTHLTQKHLLMISNKIDYVYIAKDKFMNDVYFGIKGDQLFLITEDVTKKHTTLILLEITKMNFEYMTYNKVVGDFPDFNIQMIVFNATMEQLDLEGLTEGISIDSEGNVKFVISYKKSYMDSYMENHKLLVENLKNKNYKSLKENIAYVFALINVIERDKKFKKKDKDVMKARAFAINDFKTYLKKLQEVEPEFDFATFYKESNYDKIIVDVPIDTIAGIKKIVKGILMS